MSVKLTPEDVVRSAQNAMAALDALFPPAEIDEDLIRDARQFYDLALLTLWQRGCVGSPFGSKWDSMTESAKAIWIEAMAQWKSEPAADQRAGRGGAE